MRQLLKNTKAIALLTITLISCGRGLPLVPLGTNQADRYLFERATEEIEDRNWQNARTDCRQLPPKHFKARRKTWHWRYLPWRRQ